MFGSEISDLYGLVLSAEFASVAFIVVCCPPIVIWGDYEFERFVLALSAFFLSARHGTKRNRN